MKIRLPFGRARQQEKLRDWETRAGRERGRKRAEIEALLREIAAPAAAECRCAA